MKAILLDEFGGPEVLRFGDTDRPAPKPDQVLIEVAATSVNRPDMLQRQGRYPPPAGESEIPGLEVAGTIAELGEEVSGYRAGDRVMALVAGGGYAEFAAAYGTHLVPIPGNMSFEQAACVPEAYITAYQNLFLNARLENGETVLLHGGGGGVNTAAIQISKALAPASRIIVTASSGKLERVRALGADLVVDYRQEDFAAAVESFTDGEGAHVILDHIGADYFEPNLSSLAVGGRLAVIAAMSGREVELNLGRLMVKRQSIIGSVLRPRAVDEKTAIIESFASRVMPHFASGDIEPVIDRVLPLEDAAEGHRIMEASRHFGKIVLAISRSR